MVSSSSPAGLQMQKSTWSTRKLVSLPRAGEIRRHGRQICILGNPRPKMTNTASPMHISSFRARQHARERIYLLCPKSKQVRFVCALKNESWSPRWTHMCTTHTLNTSRLSTSTTRKTQFLLQQPVKAPLLEKHDWLLCQTSPTASSPNGNGSSLVERVRILAIFVLCIKWRRLLIRRAGKNHAVRCASLLTLQTCHEQSFLRDAHLKDNDSQTIRDKKKKSRRHLSLPKEELRQISNFPNLCCESNPSRQFYGTMQRNHR